MVLGLKRIIQLHDVLVLEFIQNVHFLPQSLPDVLRFEIRLAQTLDRNEMGGELMLRQDHSTEAALAQQAP